MPNRKLSLMLRLRESGSPAPICIYSQYVVAILRACNGEKRKHSYKADRTQKYIEIDAEKTFHLPTPHTPAPAHQMAYKGISTPKEYEGKPQPCVLGYHCAEGNTLYIEPQHKDEYQRHHDINYIDSYCYHHRYFGILHTDKPPFEAIHQ